MLSYLKFGYTTEIVLHNADNKLLFTPMFSLPFYAHFSSIKCCCQEL